MLPQAHVKDIKFRKKAIKESMERQRQAIIEYDLHTSQNPNEPLKEEDVKAYAEFDEEADRLKRQLDILRLEADSFSMFRGMARFILDINARGAMTFFKIVPTQQPLIPADMALYSHVRLEIVEDGYEVRFIEKIKYIDELKLVATAPIRTSGGPTSNFHARTLRWTNSFSSKINGLLKQMDHNGDIDSHHSFLPPGQPTDEQFDYSKISAEMKGVKFDWKDSTDTYTVDEAQELVEVIGCHLNKFKRSKVEQVQKLRQLYEQKMIQYDSSTPDHEEFLMKLWHYVFPDVELTSRRSNQWKLLGFQGSDPATDFRGMGLLGLYNLLYFASSYTDIVRQILAHKRDYPFSAAGINITNMLLDLLSMDEEALNDGSTSRLWENPFLIFFCTASDDSGINTNAFEELYCMTFEMFDSLWVKMNAKYMDFPRVIASVKEMVKEVVAARPEDWIDFRNRVNRIIVVNGSDSPSSNYTTTTLSPHSSPPISTTPPSISPRSTTPTSSSTPPTPFTTDTTTTS